MAKSNKKEMKRGPQTLVQNRKARHEYEVIEKYEAGIELRGSEVKSLREGGGSIQESYVLPRRGEIFLTGMLIPPYTAASMAYVEASTRDRKLLLNMREIEKLTGAVSQKGMTIVPLRVYLNERGLVKVEIALAKGKTTYDRRQDLKERQIKREIDREYKVR